MLDLTKLISNFTDSIDLNYEVEMPSTYRSEEIKDLSKIKVIGNIFKDDESDLYIKIKASGKMLILDSISLEEVWYPFSFEIDEKLKETVENFENTLDIIELLWQNIVLEVPLRYSIVEDYSKYKGDGWVLISEEQKQNTLFEQLKNLEDGSDK